MKVLVVGAGGREHAFAWKIAKSPLVKTVYVAPGNAGTALEKKTCNVSIPVHDIQALVAFAQKESIGLTIVGPEQPLVSGIVDSFTQHQLPVFGPTRAASKLEGSKAFSKEFLAKHDIPTAAYAVFTDPDPAYAYIDKVGAPIVIKADGLAAGKGVVVAMTRDQARAAIADMLEKKKFGNAGSRVVIEEFLVGEEASFIAMVAGEQVLPLAGSQDHKARDNGDTGPNTGGMGAYSPAPVLTPELHDRVMREIMEPTVKGLAAMGIPYCGFLYAGLMIDSHGNPKVLEYNCRFGDPETQPIMMRLKSDLVGLCQSALRGDLAMQMVEWDSRAALGVVMAAGGYPGNYRKGDEITGIPDENADLKVFHAGTSSQNGKLLTSGGRVFCVTALGDNVLQAQLKAYAAARAIRWENVYYRSDIGYRAVAREANKM